MLLPLPNERRSHSHATFLYIFLLTLLHHEHWMKYRRGMNQAAAGMTSAFNSMGQQVQKAAIGAAADAAAKEVTNQLTQALSGGGRRK